MYGVFAVYHLGFSSKQFQSCNKSLINQACSGPYWENIGPWTFFHLKSLIGSGFVIAQPYSLLASKYIMYLFGLLGSYPSTSGLFVLAYLFVLAIEIPPLIPLSTNICFSRSVKRSSSTPVLFKRASIPGESWRCVIVSWVLV